MRKRTVMGIWFTLVCVLLLSLPVESANASQPAEPVDWDLLSNGLLEVQYDENGDGVPDYVTVHQVTWSGWTTQPLSEIEAQAAAERQWVFIVEYDKDRYVYLANEHSVFAADDVRQAAPWATLPSPCLLCAR